MEENESNIININAGEKLTKSILQEYQNTIDELNSTYDELKSKRIEFDNQNKGIIEKIDMLKEEINDYKENISEDAKKEYLATGKKQLLGGLGIRIKTILDYAEMNALQWAQEHKLCLTLDKKAFEKIAKTEDIDFVKKEEGIVVTFPKRIKVE